MSVEESAHSYCYVDSNQSIKRVCRELAENACLAFDSEFIRTNTFFPKPGLYQIAGGSGTFLVDPLAIDDWNCLKQLLGASNIDVVMHSCGEDLGLLHHALNILPACLFDTQRAAAFVGYDYSLSYQALVKAELGVELPKGETRSDWLRRPLDQAQLSYAALDVAYLLELRLRLIDKMTTLGRLDWFEADCRDMISNVTDERDQRAWETAYKSIGSAWRLDENSLSLLQKLAYWREFTARERNKPRNWIAKDQDLLTLASRLSAHRTVTPLQIEKTDVFTPRFLATYVNSIVEFLGGDHEYQQDAQLILLSRPLNNRARQQLKELQNFTREVAQRESISPELLARKRQWLELLENRQRGIENFWPAGLDNWRRILLEQGAEKIITKSAA